MDLFADLELPGDMMEAVMPSLPYQQVILINQPPITVMPPVMPQPQVTFDFYIQQRSEDVNLRWITNA